MDGVAMVAVAVIVIVGETGSAQAHYLSAMVVIDGPCFIPYSIEEKGGEKPMKKQIKRTKYEAIFIDGNQWDFVFGNCDDAHSIKDVWKKLEDQTPFNPSRIPPSSVIVVAVVEKGGCRLRIVDTPVGSESLKGQILEARL